MRKCNEDWRTCGHCRVGSYAEPYPACDKAGPPASIAGGDICPNAPFPDEANAGKEAE